MSDAERAALMLDGAAREIRASVERLRETQPNLDGFIERADRLVSRFEEAIGSAGEVVGKLEAALDGPKATCLYCEKGSRVEGEGTSKGFHVLEWIEGWPMRQVFCLGGEARK